MLEAQPLNRVGQFYVHAEIVGVELEQVSRAQAAVLINLENYAGAIRVDFERKMAVARRMSLERDRVHAESIASCVRTVSPTAVVPSAGTIQNQRRWSRRRNRSRSRAARRSRILRCCGFINGSKTRWSLRR